jgi:hypothetical protein
MVRTRMLRDRRVPAHSTGNAGRSWKAKGSCRLEEFCGQVDELWSLTSQGGERYFGDECTFMNVAEVG